MPTDISQNRNKKIIIIGPAYPYRGGNALFVSSLYEILKDHFLVKIYNYSLLYPSLLFPGKTQLDESKQLIKKIENVRIINSISPFNWVKVAFKLKKENADLIIFDWWHPFFSFCHFSISLMIKKDYKRKIVFITENVISHEGHFIDRILTRLGLRNANSFLALSDIVINTLNDFKFNKKIYKSELPVYDWYIKETKNFSSMKKEDFGFQSTDKLLLFFGYIRKYKGLDILLNSLKLLVDEDKSYKLLVVGEFYENQEFYKDIIENKRLQEFVKVVNEYVPNEEVSKYFEVCDLVVLPYRSATQSGILNIAYGTLKPVVVTNVGGLSELVEDEKTGIIVNDVNPKSVADGIRKFFKLSKSTNFAENIKQKTSANLFNKIPELINQIIRDSQL